MTEDEALNAHLDGEGTPEERAALEARLAVEPALRARLEELRAADALLREAYAFAPGAAEEAAARFRVPSPAAAGGGRPAPRLPWLLLPAALAAGIAAGFLLAPGPARVEPPPAGPNPPPVVGFVAYATGEVRSPTGGALAAGTPLHDGESLEAAADARAHIVLSDGTELRLDRGARVTLPGGRRIELAGGRAWARVTPGAPFRWIAGEASVTVLGTELSVSRDPERTGVQLFSGSARVEAGGAVRTLAPGQEAEFAGGVLSEARRIESEAIATGWMLELWAHSGARDRDLADHLDRMLAEMGHRKLASLEAVTIIRELGPACRVPIARFLVSEGARSEPAFRRKAARVLERIGDRSVAPELAAALRDPDGEVRTAAARALGDFSGGRVCPDAERFRDGVDEEAAAAAEAWAREGAAAPPR